MSHIFPTAPAKVTLHNIPSNAEFISYRIHNQLLSLKAWMPPGDHTITIRESEARRQDNFYETHCRGCEYNNPDHFKENFPEYLWPFEPEDNYVSYRADMFDELREKTCCVHFRGYRGEECAKGHVMEDENNTIAVQNMVFQVDLTYLGNPPRFQKASDNAHLRAGYVDEETGVIYSTRPWSAPNVYSDGNEHYHNGNVCWGSTGHYGERASAKSLRDISTLYFQAGTNNDLLPLYRFRQFNNDLIKAVEDGLFERNFDDKFLCSGYDSLMILDADKDVQAFFTMLMAGFTSLPEAPHVMIIPIKNCSIERDGKLYFGFSTQEDKVGRSWYISSEGYLIGQLDESYSYV